MSNVYNVPTEILADQAKKSVALYHKDSAAHRQQLDGIGLSQETFLEMDQVADQVQSLDLELERAKIDAGLEKNGAAQAIAQLINWRSKKVLPRAKIALAQNKRYRHFRSDKLRSRRTASVVRESKLLVDVILHFSREPQMQARGITEALADEGANLIELAEQKDIMAARARMHQLDTTAALFELETQLSNLLVEMDRCAAVVFDADSAARRRYQLSEIKQYIAQNKARSKQPPDDHNKPD